MKIKLLLIILLISSIHAKASYNHLSLESSPYLKQHASNPVDWYPWGEKAFLKAKKENKPIFLSIGYSTCHWCHVMKRESFENKEIAKLLNRYFISIKVDREEMPHLDAYYQELHQKIKGRSGGWPLSVFMTPDKNIFYITGYIPPTTESYSEGFFKLLPHLHKLYSDKEKLRTRVTEIQKKIREKKSKHVQNDVTSTLFVESLKESYDEIYSGFGSSRKFPEAAKLSLMMDLAELTEDKELKSFSYEMLDIMALRGLYDHVEGGFFRYSVDAAWEIPHFEKMLYNQAELLQLYIRAYIKTEKKLYKDVVIQTIQMLDNRFVKNNLYYSASDAESNEEEGAYFVFSTNEIEHSLEGLKNKEEIKKLINYTKEGNFEGKIHINLFEETQIAGYDTFIKRLQKIRTQRVFPFIDTKINTAWNAMMIETLYRASAVDKSYIKKANKHLKALENMMFQRGELYHQGILSQKVTQKAFLEDYSSLIAALLSGYEADFDDEKLGFAEYLLNRAKQKFYKNGVWYLNEEGLRVPAGTKDKYYTSALSKMVQNYLNIAALKASFRYEKVAQKSLHTLSGELANKASDAPALATAYLMQKYGVVVLKSSKKNLLQNTKEIQKISYPYLLKKVQNYNDFLACTMRQCFAKESRIFKIKEAIEQIKTRN
ncbi:thioredoxin domain-containing protein [Sulfurimonas sp.]